jgi:fatty acid elongase 3
MDAQLTSIQAQHALSGPQLLLTAISGGLLVSFLEQLVPRIWFHGLYDGICGAGGWTDKLVVLYYMNYLSKYLEFVDTCFLFLKKKPLSEFRRIYLIICGD